MSSIFNLRVRGFRLVELVAFGLLVAMVFGVYLAKTMAGRDRQEIARIERQIAAEQRRIRLLKAEVAHLEQPERLGRLSEHYLGLAPVGAEREAPAENLEEIARTRAATPPPTPAAVVAANAATAAAAGAAAPAVPGAQPATSAASAVAPAALPAAAPAPTPAAPVGPSTTPAN